MARWCWPSEGSTRVFSRKKREKKKKEYKEKNQLYSVLTIFRFIYPIHMISLLPKNRSRSWLEFEFLLLGYRYMILRVNDRLYIENLSAGFYVVLAKKKKETKNIYRRDLFGKIYALKLSLSLSLSSSSFSSLLSLSLSLSLHLLANTLFVGGA